MILGIFQRYDELRPRKVRITMMMGCDVEDGLGYSIEVTFQRRD